MLGPLSNPYTMGQTARKHSAEQSELFQLRLGIKRSLVENQGDACICRSGNTRASSVNRKVN